MLLSTTFTSYAATVDVIDLYTNVTVIYVDCDDNCTMEGTGSSLDPYRCLDQAVSALQNDTLIYIPNSTMCPIKKNLSISGYVNIGIAGNANLTLNCQNAGLYMANILDLRLTNFTLSHCGAVFNSSSTNTSSYTSYKFNVSMYIINVTNLAVHSANFHSSTGMGLAVYDTNGNISIINSDFINNQIPQSESTHLGGGGMLLHYSYCTPGLTNCDPSTNMRNRDSTILIDGCNFIGNRANNTYTLKSFNRQRGNSAMTLGNGGALGITFAGSSHSNNLTLQNLVFHNNFGHFGGAISVQFIDNANSNNFSMANTHMESNRAVKDGGALRIGFEFYKCEHNPCVSDNYVNVTNVTFLSNRAKWGGAVECFSSRTENTSCCNNKMKFNNCTWELNYARLGAAMDVAPDAFTNLQTSGRLPTLVIKESVFVKNSLITSQSEILTGVLNICMYNVQLDSFVRFERNHGTALYGSDSVIVIGRDTQVNFMSNIATTSGGGMALVGSSVLHTHTGSHLYFTNNTALEFGGAIYYYSTNPSIFIYSHGCFIQNADSTAQPTNWSNVTFYFANNTATEYGSAIYADTLFPCARQYGYDNNGKLGDMFSEPTFQYYNQSGSSISTFPHRLDFNPQTLLPLEVAPGQIFPTGISALDELNQTVTTILHASIVDGSENASINPVYSYTVNGTIQVSGTPSKHPINISLHTISLAHIEKKIQITLTNCPPGYNFNNNTSPSHSSCVCSANGDSKQKYDGILRCNNTAFKAILKAGYWAGCQDDHNEIITGLCPIGFCNQTTEDLELPHACSDLNGTLCGQKNRTGRLCGECVKNYTVHYHSKHYTCGDCKYPELGPVFYVLSELLPLTLLFAVIVIFGISFTSGPANSFIFFAQVLNFFSVTYTQSGTYKTLTNIYQFIFGIFNFEFFTLESDQLSFCLWKNASVLDMLVFKYITTTYAMVVLLIFILAVTFIPRCYSCMQRFVFKHTITSSLIEAISALLIISYAQCANVSFQILDSETLKGKGLHSNMKVVSLNGSVEYFHREHLPYAIPAIFVLVLTIIPPSLFILHPALTKLCGKYGPSMGYKRDEEHDYVHCISKWNSRMKPFLDSFQGCFKDNCRYFAGLYFVYRLAISMTFALSDNGMVELYVILEVIVIVMLALHSIMQPYRNPFYNILDAAIFADLAIINGLSIYNFYLSQYSDNSTEMLKVTTYIQVVLIYLPLVYMTIMVGLKIATRYARVRRIQWIRRVNHYVPLINEQWHDRELTTLSNSHSFSENHLPHRLFDREDSTHNGNQQNTTYGAAAIRATM